MNSCVVFVWITKVDYIFALIHLVVYDWKIHVYFYDILVTHKLYDLFLYIKHYMYVQTWLLRYNLF